MKSKTYPSKLAHNRAFA